jgi:hypothetical protein
MEKGKQLKIPKNKLPLLLGRLGAWGQYNIMYVSTERADHEYDSEEVITVDKYAGRIAGKDLARYVVTATNNFATALDLLEEALVELHTKGDEDTLELALLISQFTNKIKRNGNKD